MLGEVLVVDSYLTTENHVAFEDILLTASSYFCCTRKVLVVDSHLTTHPFNKQPVHAFIVLGEVLVVDTFDHMAFGHHLSTNSQPILSLAWGQSKCCKILEILERPEFPKALHKFPILLLRDESLGCLFTDGWQRLCNAVCSDSSCTHQVSLTPSQQGMVSRGKEFLQTEKFGCI